MIDDDVKAQRPTIRTVADQAGVSTATVSYVLSGRSGRKNAPGVSSQTQARVKAAARELGYVPNAAARTIRTGKTNIILLILTYLSDPWALEVIDSVRKAAATAGMTPMILADVDWTAVLAQQQADVIFIDAIEDTPQQHKALAELAAQGKKVVVLSEDLDPAGFDVVRSNAVPGCDVIMNHLTAQHSKIGVLSLVTSSRDRAQTRFGSYLRGLDRAGIPVREEYIGTVGASALSAFDAAIALLSLPEPPTAIFATSDFMAIAAINAAQRLGLTVGQDVVIAGAGNTREGETMTPSLTSVGPRDFFEKLAELLIERALSASPGSGELFDFPWHLFVRESAPAIDGDSGPLSFPRYAKDPQQPLRFREPANDQLVDSLLSPIISKEE